METGLFSSFVFCASTATKYFLSDGKRVFSLFIFCSFDIESSTLSSSTIQHTTIHYIRLRQQLSREKISTMWTSSRCCCVSCPLPLCLTSSNTILTHSLTHSSHFSISPAVVVLTIVLRIILLGFGRTL